MFKHIHYSASSSCCGALLGLLHKHYIVTRHSHTFGGKIRIDWKRDFIAEAPCKSDTWVFRLILIHSSPEWRTIYIHSADSFQNIGIPAQVYGEKLTIREFIDKEGVLQIL